MSFGIAATVIGTVGGALIGSDSNRRAVNTQKDAADAATALQQQQYEQTRADNAGYRARGNSAGDKLAMLLGLNPTGDGVSTIDTSNPLYGSLTKPFTGADLVNDPGYKFGLDQGNRNIQNSASAKGGLYSGSTLKALQRYGTDYGGTKFNEAFNRNETTNNRLYNQLAGVAGTGQIATNQVNSAGANYANNAGSNIIGAGNAAAAGSLAQGNILTGAINQGLSMWQRPGFGGMGGQNNNGYGGYGNVLYGDGYGPG